MNTLKLVAATAILTVPALLTSPSQAKTAFQYWAQGRGTYVPSKERLSNFQDDLTGLGLEPPPPPLRYRYRRLQEEYGGSLPAY